MTPGGWSIAMTRRSVGRSSISSCQNSADETLPWMSTTVRSGGVAGSSPSRSSTLTVSPGVSTLRAVMPSKSVMSEASHVVAGAPASPHSRG